MYEYGQTWTIEGPDGTTFQLNASNGVYLEDVTGFDSPNVRSNVEDLPEADGAVAGDFYYGSRSVTLKGRICNVTAAERNQLVMNLQRAVRGLRSDVVLRSQPSGMPEMRVTARLDQPVRVTGGFVKEFLVSLVCPDPRIYSQALNTKVGPVNLVANASFETNTAGWTAQSAATLARDVADARFGIASLLVTPPGSVGEEGAAYRGDTLGGGTFGIPVTPSVVHTFSAYVKGTAGRKLRLLVAEHNTATTQVATTRSTDLTLDGTWQRLSVTLTMNANTATARFMVITAETTAVAYRVDGVQVELGSTVSEYAGDTPTAVFPWSFPVDFGGGIGTRLTVSAANAGNADVAPLIRVWGPLDNPAIQNTTTGQILYLDNTSLAAGQWVEVNMAARTVTRNDATSAYDKVRFPASVWWTLVPGSNTVRVFGSNEGGSAEVDVTWRDSWL